jgi:Flavodoxin domain
VNAIVVYESLWGNTQAVARAIADGLGSEARALSTGEATGEALADVDLIVAGAPVLGFKLPTEQMRRGAHDNPGGKPPRAADLSHPSMRSWLDGLPAGQGRSAAFDTQVRGPFGKAAPAIAEALEKAGYARLADPVGFTVAGKFGPLRKGELDRAKRWGSELAAAYSQ